MEGHDRMTAWVFALTIITGMMSSTGLWSYLQRRADKKDLVKDGSLRLLLGIAHDRIIFLGKQYIRRGWISTDEYEDFFHYLGDPYSEFGGNGLADKVMKDVKALPLYEKPTMGNVPLTENKENYG